MGGEENIPSTHYFFIPESQLKFMDQKVIFSTDDLPPSSVDVETLAEFYCFHSLYRLEDEARLAGGKLWGQFSPGKRPAKSKLTNKKIDEMLVIDAKALRQDKAVPSTVPIRNEGGSFPYNEQCHITVCKMLARNWTIWSNLIDKIHEFNTCCTCEKKNILMIAEYYSEFLFQLPNDLQVLDASFNEFVSDECKTDFSIEPASSGFLARSDRKSVV